MPRADEATDNDGVTEEERRLEAKPFEAAEDKQPQTQPKQRKLPKLLTAGKRRLTKKQWLIIGVVAALLAGGGTAFALLLRGDQKPPPPPPVAQQKPAEPPKTTEPSRLTGVEVPIEMNKRPVTGVMIENSPDARPQAGLKDAGIVVEAIAEGGITRFMALFQEAQPDYIGPVRSVRPYYLDFLVPFDASIAHAGGSAEALAQIRQEKIKDLDHAGNGAYYTRVKNRFAPHNLYTSMAQLDTLNQKKGYTTSNFTGFARKKESPNTPPSVGVINLNISSVIYNVQYTYEPATNSYKRVMGGKPHVDERSAAQIQPKVVIVLIMAKGTHPDRIHSTYATTGTGKLFIFQDGVVIDGTWQKANRSSQITFTDATGKTVSLNPGQTWITLLGEASRLSYGP